MRLLSIMLSVLLLTLIAGCGDPAGPGPDSTPPTPSILTGFFSGDTLPVLSVTASTTAGFITLPLREGKDSHQGTLSWTSCPDGDFLKYELYRGDSPGIESSPGEAEIVACTGAADDTVWIEEDLPWGSSAWYALLTVNSEELVSWSNEVQLLMPGSTPEPSTLEAVSAEFGIDLVWSACRDYDFFYYTLYRSESPGIEENYQFADMLINTDDPHDTTFTDSLPALDIEFWYAVRTRNHKGFTSWSNEVEAVWSSWYPTYACSILDYPVDMVLNASRDLVVTGHRNDTLISLFDPGSHDLGTLPAPRAEYLCAHPWDDRVYISALMDELLAEIDIYPYAAVTRSLRLNALPGEGCVDPSGEILYVPAMDDHTIWVIDTESFSIRDLAYADSRIRSLFVHPSGEFLYGISRVDGTLDILSTVNTQMLGTVQVGSQPMDLTFSPDASLLYISCAGSDEVVILSVPEHDPMGAIEVASPRGMCVHPSGNMLYVISEGDRILVYSIPAYEHIWTITPGGTVVDIAALPSGSELVVTYGDGSNWFIGLVDYP